MAISSDTLFEHLCSLRRYATVLIEDESAAERLVFECAEQALREAGRIRPDNVKLDLFILFHRIWTMNTAQGAASSPAPSFALIALPASRRQAVVAMLVEEFELNDVAAILGTPRSEIDRFLLGADAIEHPDAVRSDINVLIVEDEYLSALDLADVVERMGHHVCGMTAGTLAAFEMANTHKPHLVLADIRLTDGDDGVDAVQQIRTRLDIPVIFVTGYPRDLIGKRTRDPTFVVEKPVDEEQLRVAIDLSLRLAPPNRISQ
ncbi:response regulator [Marinivivus vitaminiproducens]|uniref:response regulator n=1 Tax=Marinivivus vitaminiproducens TaxID=3035935 RepID=UPI0027A022A0|nr:response regulator [Geminicoccaceae bacterium SCSIO 64248]